MATCGNRRYGSGHCILVCGQSILNLGDGCVYPGDIFTTEHLTSYF